MGIEIINDILLSPLVYALSAFVTIIVLFTIQLLVFKKLGIIQIICVVFLTVLTFIIPINHIALKIVFAILFWGLAGYAIYDFIVTYQIYSLYDKELNNFLKNNEFDFFVQTNAKDKIVNYSNKLLKITKMTKKELKGVYCWKLLIDYLKVNKINKNEVSIASISDFLKSFKEANSKHVIYQFEFEMPKIDSLTTDSQEEKEELTLFKYIGLIQPVYYRKKLIGRNIYFYQDRMQALTDLRNALKQAAHDLDTAHNFIYIMMSLTDYIGMFFDYSTRTYVATESFVKFTRTHQREYTFNQFMDLMHPDDVDKYIEQSATINSIAVTRLKYRMLINDEYYYVLEDSININKDADLVSVIRILNKTDEEVTREIPYSNQEVESVLDSLSITDIGSIISKTENILNTVVGIDDEEN